MANISKIAVGGTEYDIAGVGLIATIETTLTASKTYNVGDQFIYNGLLYKVTQTIASGTAITIGSNCQLAPVVADQLSEINSNLAVITDTTIATGVVLKKTGNIVQLTFSSYNVTQSIFFTLASKYRPSNGTSALVRYKNTSDTYYTGILSVLANGSVSASYFTGTSTYGISSGQISGSITYVL